MFDQYTDEIEVFVLVLPTIAVGKVTALDHEGLDDAVEGGSLIAKALFARRECSVPFVRFRGRLSSEREQRT